MINLTSLEIKDLKDEYYYEDVFTCERSQFINYEEVIDCYNKEGIWKPEITKVEYEFIDKKIKIYQIIYLDYNDYNLLTNNYSFDYEFAKDLKSGCDKISDKEYIGIFTKVINKDTNDYFYMSMEHNRAEYVAFDKEEFLKDAEQVRMFNKAKIENM